MNHRIVFATAAIASLMALQRPMGGQLPPSRAVSYSDIKTLPLSRLIEFDNLAFPQSYSAMTRRFGYPNKRDSEADYYRLSRGCWVAISYVGRTATGYQKGNCPAQTIVKKPIETINW